MSLWKIFVIYRSTPSCFYTNVRNFRTPPPVDDDIVVKKRRQWWSCQSNYHQHQHFPVTHVNIKIIETTPLSRASDHGKKLCAHLLLFDKTYHIMKSACISCMILTMALCSPLFPRFIGQKWKWRCANSELNWIKPHAQPPASGFLKFILVAEKWIF